MKTSVERQLVVVTMAFILFFTHTYVLGALISVPQGSKNATNGLPRALENIPQANLTCRRDAINEVPIKKAGSSTLSQPDQTCAIDTNQFLKFLKGPNSQLVDLRSTEEFNASHIDGALNLSEAEIRVNRFLTSKLVMLIGNGKSDQYLYSVCGDLKSQGYGKVYVLRGGMLSWMLDKGAIVGKEENYMQAASLDSAELYQQSKISNNVVIALAGTEKLAELIPGAIRHNSTNASESIKPFLIQAKKQKKKISPNFILLADKGPSSKQLADLAEIVKPGTLMFYSGSEKDYRQFMTMQNALWKKMAKGPTKPVCGGR